MTDTMNDMNPEDRHSYDRYMLEVMQVEYDKREEMLRESACITCGTAGTCDACYERDERDAEVHGLREHTNVNATQAADVNVTRVSTYETGVVAPDGYRERVTVLLCACCDREAEYAGYCEEHYALRQEENTLQELQEHDEWVEGRDATQDDEMACDVWLDDLYSREELERLSELEQERRNDQ